MFSQWLLHRDHPAAKDLDETHSTHSLDYHSYYSSETTKPSFTKIYLVSGCFFFVREGLRLTFLP